MPDRPYITVDPQVRFGRPRIRDTGVTIGDVVGRVWGGDSAEDVAEDYDLTRADVLVACWFVAAYGAEDVAAQLDGHFKRWGRTLSRRWEQWADASTVALGKGEYDDVPDPPSNQPATATAAPSA